MIIRYNITSFKHLRVHTLIARNKSTQSINVQLLLIVTKHVNDVVKYKNIVSSTGSISKTSSAYHFWYDVKILINAVY